MSLFLSGWHSDCRNWQTLWTRWNLTKPFLSFKPKQVLHSLLRQDLLYPGLISEFLLQIVLLSQSSILKLITPLSHGIQQVLERQRSSATQVSHSSPQGNKNRKPQNFRSFVFVGSILPSTNRTNFPTTYDMLPSNEGTIPSLLFCWGASWPFQGDQEGAHLALSVPTLPSSSPLYSRVEKSVLSHLQEMLNREVVVSGSYLRSSFSILAFHNTQKEFCRRQTGDRFEST